MRLFGLTLMLVLAGCGAKEVTPEEAMAGARGELTKIDDPARRDEALDLFDAQRDRVLAFRDLVERQRHEAAKRLTDRNVDEATLQAFLDEARAERLVARDGLLQGHLALRAKLTESEWKRFVDQQVGVLSIVNRRKSE